MGQINSREVVLLASQTITTNGSSSDINVPMGWQAATISINASTVTGTSPTFNFFVQKKLRQAASTDLVGTDATGTAIYDDVLAFTQINTNSTRIASLATGAAAGSANTTVITTADWLQQDGALTAGDIRIGPIGPLWRVKWTVGGTSPSGSFFVTAQLIPWST